MMNSVFSEKAVTVEKKKPSRIIKSKNLWGHIWREPVWTPPVVVFVVPLETVIVAQEVIFLHFLNLNIGCFIPHASFLQ